MTLPALARISVTSLLVIACTQSIGATASPTSTPRPSTGPPTPSATLTPAPTPLATQAATPIVTPAAPPPTDYEQQPPPTLEIVVEDGGTVPGYQGSWCFDVGCADIVPPDKSGLPRVDAPGGGTLIAEIADSAPIVYWRVRYGSSPDSEALIEVDEGGTRTDPDAVSSPAPESMTHFVFVPAPVGDWVVAISVQFADNRGDALYLWHVVVPEHGTRPPTATLEGAGEPVGGEPGSYCYGDTCADIGEWPPKRDLPEVVAAAGADGLEFALTEDVQFVDWRAAYAATSNGDDDRRLADGRPDGYDPDVTPETPWPTSSTVSFPSPPAGDWVVFVNVDLAGGGDLSYAWHVTVN